MHWSERWLGKPYAVLGRGPDAFDCLGLFMAVQNAEFGLSLDYGLVPKGPEEESVRARHASGWQRVDVATEGCAVLMQRGRGWHIGVAIDASRMLHAARPASVIESFLGPKWGRRLEGVYAYVH
ncbi:MAG: C40 family peptidase [Maritimibacter sp.]|uniref:NlpC/P60 family protein n=1 Tax=Maritimibacter sp. TaxID=2003363 RepID=UPI001D27E9AF|nr:NlpC/P60 family protein [Maritimibacter sp.]MBL6427349.1 C40 family peptidase [Maritimibacter sp.]